MALGFTIVNCLFGANIILVGNILLVFGTCGGAGGGLDNHSKPRAKRKEKVQERQDKPSSQASGKHTKKLRKMGDKGNKKPNQEGPTEDCFILDHPSMDLL